MPVCLNASTQRTTGWTLTKFGKGVIRLEKNFKLLYFKNSGACEVKATLALINLELLYDVLLIDLREIYNF